MNRRCSQTQAAAWIVLLTVFNLLLALLPLAANAGIVTWDNGGDDGAWSTGNNWSGTPDNTEPAIVADAAFPTPVAGSGTIALSAGELANSLTFNDTYTLASGGTLYLGSHGATSAGYITVAASKTATIASPLYGNGWDQGASGLTKAGDGTLELTANDPTFTGGITINGGRLTTEPTDATSINRLGNNRITINGGELVLRMNDATPAGAHAVYTREVAGSGGKVTRNLSAALETTWSISAIEDATYSGSLDHGYADDKWIVSKVGPGLQEFTGTLLTNSRWRLHKVFGGELRIGGDVDHSSGTAFGNSSLYASGTLTVDNTAKNISERLPDNNYEFGGGTLKLLGSSAAASREGVGMMSLTAGYASTVDIQTGSGQTATLTFTSLTRGSGSAVNVKYTNNGTGTAGLIFGTTAPTLVNGIVSGMFVNGADFATHENDRVPETISALAAYANPASIDSLVAADNALVDGAMTDQQLSGAVSANAMKMSGAQTIDLNGNTLTVDTGMILKTGSGSATISGGGSLYHSAAGDFIVRVDAGDLTISAPVDLAGNGSLGKSGSGVLILEPASAWPSGSTDYVRPQEGAIRLDPTSNFAASDRWQLAGGVFELTANWSPAIGTGGGNVSWAIVADGGFAAYDGTRTVTLGSTLTWETANHVRNGKALLLSSDTANAKIAMANGIDLAGGTDQMWFREFRVGDNTGSTADYAEITGVISGTSNRSHLLKTGPGRLDLSTATSTYEGETIVHGGTLNVNGALAAVTGTGSHGTVTVMSGATLGGTGTINRPVTVNSGGKLAPGEGAGTLSVTGNVTMNAGGVFEVELGSSTCDLLDVTGTVRCGGTLTGVQIGSETIKRTYTVITAGSQVTGTFDNGEVTVGGVKLKIVYESNAVKLKAGDPGSLFVVR